MADATTPDLARQACTTCRRQKRRCTRQLPSCELCKKNRRACEYPAEALSELATPSMSTTVSYDAHAQNEFPALFFLDSYIFQRRNCSIPPPMATLPTEYAELITLDAQLLSDAECYFKYIHPSLPVVSKLRFLQNARGPLTSVLDLDETILVIAMRLFTRRIEGNIDAATTLYRKAKQCYSYFESSGFTSFRVLQGLLLISYYEIANAVYPAAYLTIGTCARLGHALGLHNRKGASQMHPTTASWKVLEEIRRTWWGVLILDRYVNLGIGGRPFACADASPDELLPMDENFWEAGEPTVIPSLAVSAETKHSAPPYARTCQAAHLLSRIIRHTNEKPPSLPMWYQEALQLHALLDAFTAAVTLELEQTSQGTGIPGDFLNILPAISLCYSAQLNLYDVHTCAEVDNPCGVGIPEQLEIQRVALSSIKLVCFSVSDLATKVNTLLCSIETQLVSPLVADCLYQAGKYVLWYIQETNRLELMTLVKEITNTLDQISKVWAVANEYLDILGGDDLQPVGSSSTSPPGQ